MKYRPPSLLSRLSRRLAVATTLVLVAGATAAVAASPAQASVACDVTYAANSWTSSPGQGGFTANITLKNTGDPITSWSLAFDFPTTGQKYTPTGWSANWSQSGTRVTAT
ncbi:cellulose binding domain-containing protein, partial [Nonomuraea helvata]